MKDLVNAPPFNYPRAIADGDCFFFSPTMQSNLIIAKLECKFALHSSNFSGSTPGEIKR